MAISEYVPGLEVMVLQDGKSLKEHVDNEILEDERTTTRYISAKSGTTFSIHFKVTKGTVFKGNCLALKIEVDGNWIQTPLIEKSLTQRENHVEIVTGVKVGKDMIRDFKFAALETASDGRVFNDEAAKVQYLGGIIVRVSHKKMGSIIKASEIQNPMEGIGIVSEKAVKGRTLSHSVRFGHAKKNLLPSANVWQTTAVKGIPNPVAIFNFQYRSIKALKAMLIIPRTPSPPPLEERDIGTLSQAELVELQKQLKQMKEKQASAIKIKRERADKNPRPRKMARPGIGDTQLEIDDGGDVRESSSSTPVAAGPQVIVLD